jgi:hypothetical protein
LQQFHINIKYKTSISNYVTNYLIRPPVYALTTVLQSCGHEASEWPQLYQQDTDFATTYYLLGTGATVTDFHIQDGLLFHWGHLYVPTSERAKMIWESHYSRVARHFGIEKTVVILQKHFYWPKIRQDVGKYIRYFIVYAIVNPTIKKKGLYTPLPIPEKPWESISIDYMSGLSSTKHRSDWMFVVVDRFLKMAILTAYKKNVVVADTAKILFERVWVHFGIPQTKLTKSTTFHPQTNGQTEVINRIIVHILCMYNSKHPGTWDESLPYVQHSYNRALHSSTSHSPFQVGLGFQTLGPIDVALPLATA